MRELTINESAHVSGSIGAETAITIALLAGTGIVLGSIWSRIGAKPAPHVVYEPRITETRTPVYDAAGRYEGDMVDTYTTYDPVVVYS